MAAEREAVQSRTLAILAGTHTVNDLYQGVIPVLVLFLVMERHYSYAAAMGITLAAAVVSSVVQPLLGVLADRREMHWLTPAGIGVAALGVAVAGLSDEYWFTWLAIALSGVGVAAYHPETFRAAKRAAGPSAHAMSWFAVGGNVGVAVAPVMASPVLNVTGLGGTPLLALPAALTVLALVLMRGPGEHRLLAAPPAARTKDSEHDDWRMFGWLTVAVIARSITYFGVSSLIALLLVDRFGVSKGLGAAALTAFTGVGIVGTVLGGWLADRVGRVRTARLGYLVTLPALLALLLAPSVPWAFLAAAALGLGVYIPFSVHITLGQEYLPGRAGTASGVTVGLTVSVGGIAAPFLGALADARGVPTAVGVLMAAPVVSLLASTRLRDRSGLAEDEHRGAARVT